MDIPSEAIEALKRATARSKRRSSVNFPITYVKRGDATPTAAWLVRSHELRLKLHMNLVMQATKAPHTLPDRPMMALIEIPQSCSSEFLRSRGQVSAGSCRS